MFHQTSQAERTRREAKFYVVPALIVAGWVTLAGGFIASVSQPPSLRNSIETVLRSPSAAQPSTLIALARADQAPRLNPGGETQGLADTQKL